MLPRPYLYVISFCNNTSSNDRSFLADFAKKEYYYYWSYGAVPTFPFYFFASLDELKKKFPCNTNRSAI